MRWIGLGVLLVTLLCVVVLLRRRRRHRGEPWPRSDRLQLAGIVAASVLAMVPIVIDLTASAPDQDRPRTNFVDEPVAVEDRSATEQQAVNGIRLAPGGRMTFQDVSGVTRTITAHDWNTIAANSRVPETVRLVIDPGFTTDPTMLRRSQYLADVAGKPLAGRVSFISPGTFTDDSGGATSALLVVNGYDGARDVTRLDFRLKSRDGKELLSGHFFTEEPLVVPGTTTYLTVLRWTPEEAKGLRAVDLEDIQSDFQASTAAH